MPNDFQFLVPKKERVGVRCGFCPVIIWRDNEANGRLFVKQGKPICACCRVMRGRYGRQIEKEVPRKRAEDSAVKENLLQRKANDHAIDIAMATQQSTKTQIQK